MSLIDRADAGRRLASELAGLERQQSVILALLGEASASQPAASDDSAAKTFSEVG